MTTLAFDVYGTLIDTHGVVTALEGLVGDKAQAFSQTWRDKQLEYSFRRGLMQNYETFAVCTSQALEYSCAYYKTSLTDEQKNDLLNIYRSLPAFDDVKNGLSQLKVGGFRLYAFSNGAIDALERLLSAADGPGTAWAWTIKNWIAFWKRRVQLTTMADLLLSNQNAPLWPVG